MSDPVINDREFSRHMAVKVQQELETLRQRLARLAASERPVDQRMAQTYRRLIERRESLILDCQAPYRISSPSGRDR